MIQTSLHTLDLVIIAVYLASLAGVGIYFSRRQKNLDVFFLARKSMTWLPVAARKWEMRRWCRRRSSRRRWR